MTALPKITVVTPSYNQAAFLETTIRSVLGQRYPHLEYMVLDGGSTDGSAAIIQQYERELAFSISERDGGQANAINRGFARATGDIFCWINSDDFHFPDTLWRVAALLGPRVDEPVILTGSCLVFEEPSGKCRIETPVLHDPARLRRCDTIVQPSTFWTAAAWRKTGPLDDARHFAFDWEWLLRALECCAFEQTPDLLAAYRVHPAHKTGSGSDARRAEILRVMREFAPPRTAEMYEWIRQRPQFWPAVRTYRNWRGLNLPPWVALALTPRLLAVPARFPRAELLDCFNML